MAIFKDSAFTEFRASLDAEMKRLQEKGLGSKHKQAQLITEEEEEILWEKGELGDHTPQSLLNTIVYMNGVYFALRSGKEHRNLRFSPSQINISFFLKDGDRAYVEYVEELSKNHPGGLKERRLKQKAVKHHANITKQNLRCFVRLLRKYKEMCSSDPKNNAFYLADAKRSYSVAFQRARGPSADVINKIVSR